MNAMKFGINMALVLFLLVSCSGPTKDQPVSDLPSGPYVVVLGIAQDAGYPQAGCDKVCNERVTQNPELKRHVSCLAIVDPESGRRWLLDATPDLTEQLSMLEEIAGKGENILDGIFLTHAHIGHYTGLMYLGREAIGASKVPVYAMPGMKEYLTNDGPWSQLVELENIVLKELASDSAVSFGEIQVIPFLVPHRDELSETVGYKVIGPQKSMIFIPDIDKWDKWDRDIVEEIRAVDYAFLDGSFFEDGEIPGRDMSQIPHPFLVESFELFKELNDEDKAKVHFIHFNHTNPVLWDEEARLAVFEKGFEIAEEGMQVEL